MERDGPESCPLPTLPVARGMGALVLAGGLGHGAAFTTVFLGSTKCERAAVSVEVTEMQQRKCQELD